MRTIKRKTMDVMRKSVRKLQRNSSVDLSRRRLSDHRKALPRQHGKSTIAVTCKKRVFSRRRSKRAKKKRIVLQLQGYEFLLLTQRAECSISLLRYIDSFISLKNTHVEGFARRVDRRRCVDDPFIIKLCSS